MELVNGHESFLALKTMSANSGYAVLDKAVRGTKDVAQCVDFPCEEAKRRMGFLTGRFFSVSAFLQRIWTFCVQTW